MIGQSNEDVFDKHRKEKEELNDKIKDKFFVKMKYFLDCGFNLLIFGIGSKWNIINTFMYE